MDTYFIDYNTVMEPVKSDKNKQLIRITVFNKSTISYNLNVRLKCTEC
jgi:hypothetical protein